MENADEAAGGFEAGAVVVANPASDARFGEASEVALGGEVAVDGDKDTSRGDQGTPAQGQILLLRVLNCSHKSAVVWNALFSCIEFV